MSKAVKYCVPAANICENVNDGTQKYRLVCHTPRKMTKNDV